MRLILKLLVINFDKSVIVFKLRLMNIVYINLKNLI